MAKMSNVELAKYLTEHDYRCAGVACKDCPLEFAKRCNYDLKSWTETILNMDKPAIMDREEMFEYITKQFDNGMSCEDIDAAQRYFKELIKPIVEEMKRFYKGYMTGMTQNNQTICEPVQLPRICSLVFNEVEEELRKEMLYDSK